MNAAQVHIFVRSSKKDPPRRIATLTGGQEACAAATPGAVEVDASGRWPYPTEEREPRICKSNVLGMKLERGKRVDIWISPRGEKGSYSCGWNISTTDPAKG